MKRFIITEQVRDEIIDVLERHDVLAWRFGLRCLPELPDDGGGIAELEQDNKRLREALEYYADKNHMTKEMSDEWENVSGEPQNWLCSDTDHPFMVEDGSVARAALSDAPAPPHQPEGERERADRLNDLQSTLLREHPGWLTLPEDERERRISDAISKQPEGEVKDCSTCAWWGRNDAPCEQCDEEGEDYALWEKSLPEGEGVEREACEVATCDGAYPKDDPFIIDGITSNGRHITLRVCYGCYKRSHPLTPAEE